MEFFFIKKKQEIIALENKKRNFKFTVILKLEYVHCGKPHNNIFFLNLRTKSFNKKNSFKIRVKTGRLKIGE